MNTWEIEPARGCRKGENDSSGEEEDEHIRRNARLVRWLPSKGGDLKRCTLAFSFRHLLFLSLTLLLFCSFSHSSLPSITSLLFSLPPLPFPLLSCHRFVPPFRHHRPSLPTPSSNISNAVASTANVNGGGQPALGGGRGRRRGGGQTSASELSSVATASSSGPEPPPTMMHNPEQIENDWNADFCSVCTDGGEVQFRLGAPCLFSLAVNTPHPLSSHPPNHQQQNQYHRHHYPL